MSNFHAVLGDMKKGIGKRGQVIKNGAKKWCQARAKKMVPPKKWCQAPIF
ncbi:hypothetical protein ES703_90131 [subsurface metagenome]